MRITVDLAKASTEPIDLTKTLNPRVGDGDLKLPFHIIYDQADYDMRGKSMDFLSEGSDQKKIYVSGTTDESSTGDDAYTGNVTFTFPTGTFKTAGTYDVDKTMFRIVDNEGNIISSVNVKMTVLPNDSDVASTDDLSYDSRAEKVIDDFKQKGQSSLDDAKKQAQQLIDDAKQQANDYLNNAKKQSDTLLDEIKQTNAEAKGNVSGDTAATATQAKQQAIDNSGKIHDLQGEVADARGRFMTLSDRENKQDFNIDRKEDKDNANANYAAQDKRNDAQDIEIAKKANQSFIIDYLSRMPLHPEAFMTFDALSTKYPNGNPGIKVTMDTGHKYIWVDNKWTDCGATQDDVAGSNAFLIAKVSSQNLLYGDDIQKWTNDVNGTVEVTTEANKQFGGTTIMHISESKAGQYDNWISSEIPVTSNVISVQLPEMSENEKYGESNNYLQIIPMTVSETRTDASARQKSKFFNLRNDQMALGKFENIELPEDTVKIVLDIVQYGVGDLYFGIPVVNYGSKCIPYSSLNVTDSLYNLEKQFDQKYQKVLSNSQNILGYLDIKDWTNDVNGTVEVTTEANKQFGGTTIMHISESKADQWDHWISPEIPVTSNIISVQLPEMNENEIYGSSHQYLQIYPLKANEKYNDPTVVQKSKMFGLNNSTMDLGKFENIELPEDTVKIVLDIVQYGVGDLYFGIPVVNYGTTCIPYSPLNISDSLKKLQEDSEKTNSKLLAQAKAASQNILYGMKITDFNNLVKGKVTIGTEADKQFAGTTIMHITGTESGQWNNWRSDPIPVSGDTISIQLPEMDENWVYGSSKEYMQIYALADGESISSSSAQEKSQMFALSNSTMKLGKFENIKLPSDTTNIVIDFIQYGVGDLYFGIPVVNYGTTCIPYNPTVLAESLANLSSTGSSNTLPEMHINTDSSSYGYNKKPVAFRFLESGNVVSGYLNFDIQGDSSRAYDKKNFKIKLYKDADGQNKLKTKMQSSWPKTNKYNLKANWIDATQARNIVNARLVKDAVAVTPLENPAQTSKILSTEGLGQVDGFPIELYFNDDYYGLYTLNTKKDETTFGMDSKDVTNEVLSTELGKKDLTDSTKAIIDGTNWSTEIHDTATENIKGNLVKFLNFVEQSNDMDFHANLKNYIDVSSVINLILFGWLSQEYDFYSKSELFATWNNGGYWYLIPYDLDSTWGLLWDGSNVVPNSDDFDLSKTFSDPQTAWAASANDNKLQQRVINLFKPEIKKQGQLLRSTVWSTPNIIAKFKSFIDEVPTAAYQKDQEKWLNIPSKSKTSFEQIQSAVIQRGQEFDNFLSQLA